MFDKKESLYFLPTDDVDPPSDLQLQHRERSISRSIPACNLREDAFCNYCQTGLAEEGFSLRGVLVVCIGIDWL